MVGSPSLAPRAQHPGSGGHQGPHPGRRGGSGAPGRGGPADPGGRRRRSRPVQGGRSLPLPHSGRPGGRHGGQDHRGVRSGHRAPAGGGRRTRLLHPGVHRGHHGAERRPTRPGGPAGCRLDRGGGGPARSPGATPGHGRPLAGPPGGRRSRPHPGHRPAPGLRRALDVRPVRACPPDGDRRSSVGRALDQLAREPS